MRQWQARVEFLRRVDGPSSQWPNLSDSSLFEKLDQWLGPFLEGKTRLVQVQRMDLGQPLQAFLTWEHRRRLERRAPTHMTVPSGSRLRVDYETSDVPILPVKLQEMFGARDTPTLAEGQVPVMLHLLSPAGRPVQVTQNLVSFWTSDVS